MGHGDSIHGSAILVLVHLTINKQDKVKVPVHLTINKQDKVKVLKISNTLSHTFFA